MISKKLIVILFIVAALIQLYVVAGMILSQEDILKTGREFKFRTAPIDPADPFRGKYVALNYRNNQFNVGENHNWQHDQDIYVEVEHDMYGFAKIKNIYPDEPEGINDYFKARIGWINTFNDTIIVNIEFPFNRYYMEETKAHRAEKRYLESLRDTANITYSLVSIKEGNAALKDVMINGKSLKILVTEAN